MLRHIASCSADNVIASLQHTATHCNTLQRTATHCNALQRTATHCNTLQHTAKHCNNTLFWQYRFLKYFSYSIAKTHRISDLPVCCCILQRIAVCCSVLNLLQMLDCVGHFRRSVLYYRARLRKQRFFLLSLQEETFALKSSFVERGLSTDEPRMIGLFCGKIPAMMWCPVGPCSVLQCCSVLQRVAVCCWELQRYVMPRVFATLYKYKLMNPNLIWCNAMRSHVIWCNATYCNLIWRNRIPIQADAMSRNSI